MTRRENRRTRRPPFREEAPQVLVLCGGEATEYDYVRALKEQRRNPAVKVVVKALGKDPLTLVRYIAKVRDDKCYDEAWCVVDVDEFDLGPAVAEADRRQVRIAISNPCFEYWVVVAFH